MIDPPERNSQSARWPTGVWVRPSPPGRRWFPVHWSGPVWLLVTAVLYAISAEIGLRFVLRPEGITSIWPASGVALAIFCRCPRRYWGWALLGIAVALVPANFSVGRPVSVGCWYIIANVLETFLAAVVLTRVGRDRVDLSSVSQLLRLMVVAGPVIAITAAIAAAPIVFFGFAPSFWQFWRLWYVADGLGILIVTPVILCFLGATLRRLSRPRIAEAYCIFLAATISGLWIFGGGISNTLIIFDLPFIITIPLIIWAALRTDLAVTSLVSLVFATIAVLDTVEGRGPFVDRGGSLDTVLVSLQLVVMAWTVCGLAISGAVMQHRRSLQLLSEKEEQFRLLATSSPAAIVQADEMGRCVYISERWCEITGQLVDDALGQGWAKALHPDDAPNVQSQWRKACDSASKFLAEYRVLRPSGEIRWVSARMAPLRSLDGAPLGHVGIVIDVTDQKRIEEELDDRRRFNALVADLSATMIDVDADKVDEAIQDALVNLAESLDLDRVALSERSSDGEQLHMIFGYFRDGPTLANPMRMDTLHPWTWQSLNAGQSVIFDSIDDLVADCPIDKANWIGRQIKSLMLIPISIGGTGLFVFSAGTTTHARKWSDELALRFQILGETFANAIIRARAGKELQQSEGMLRKLNSELLRAEDQERRRLATALHDELAQNLFAVITQLATLRGRKETDDTGSSLDAVITSLDESLRQTRELTFELCPPVLYQLGLPAALVKLGDQFKRRFGLTFGTEVTGHWECLSSDLASLLYQVVRELLMNVVKHAEANHVDIRLEESASHLSIIVTDDGKGLCATPRQYNRSQSGFGLFNITERLRSLGGSFELASIPGKGCTVTLILPKVAPIQKEGDASFLGSGHLGVR